MTAAAVERLQEIKAAAVRHFYLRGYEGTDLRLIARDVGMSPSSFYNYIQSKSELLYLILRDGVQTILDGLEAALDGVEGAEARLRAAIRFHVVRCAEQRFVSWTNHTEIRSLEGPARDDVVARRDRYQRRWEEILEGGIRDGTFRPIDPHITAIALLTMVQSVARWYAPEGNLTPDQIADSYIALMLPGVLAVPAQP